MFQRSCAVASQQRSRSVHWNQKERSWKYLSVVRSHLLYLLKVKMRIAGRLLARKNMPLAWQKFPPGQASRSALQALLQQIKKFKYGKSGGLKTQNVLF